MYSLPHTPPAARAEMIMTLHDRVFAPAMQMIMAQGGQIDYAAITTTLADLLNMPELENVIKWSGPVEGEGGGEEASKPDITHRKYTRTSVPSGGSPQSRLASTLTGMQQASNEVGAPA